MNPVVIVLALVFVVVALLGIAYVLDVPGMVLGRSATKNQLRNIVTAQRTMTAARPTATSRANLMDTSQESKVDKKITSKLTLEKRLKFAQWKLPPVVFHGLEIAISLFAFGFAVMKFNPVIQVMTLMTGPLFMRWLLNLFVDRRFKAFDSDYPQFLLSLVGLLKTGMNVMGGLQAAAEGLEENSLVRQEVQMMIERLRFGVSEDKSIGAFGEDIYHPEIELFVQALLLSRRVGGNLSDTLDRLAKQVRKRQFFRASAAAAVSMQRGSIMFILAILVGMEVYMYFIYPEAVVGAMRDPIGWQVWQFAGIVVALGIFWIRQVTKIRV